MTDGDLSKRNAAAKALDMVEDGMLLGLGTGSTAAHFVRLLGQRVRDGLDIACVVTSEATRELAEAEDIELVAADRVVAIDLAVDGADEVDPALRLIKGGGGALLREKIVAGAAKRFVVIADGGKKVETLGRFPLPVEVVPFGFPITANKIHETLRLAGCAGRETSLRGAGKPFVTDNGNYILDCKCESIPDPAALADALARIPGVVEHGLFLDMADTIIYGRAGGADVVRREKRG